MRKGKDLTRVVCKGRRALRLENRKKREERKIYKETLDNLIKQALSTH